MSNDLIRVTKGIIYKSFSTVIVTLTGFIVSVFLARYFGKDDYARLILTYTVISFFTVFANFGIRSAVGRFIPLYLEEKREADTVFFLKSSFILTVLFTVFFSGIFFLSADFIAGALFHRQELVPLLKIGALYLLVSSFVLFVLDVFKALQRWKEESFFNILDPVLYLIGILFFIFVVKGAVKSVLWSHVLAGLTTIFLAAFILQRRLSGLKRSKISIDKLKEKAREILTFSSPLLFSNFIFYLMMWFDRAMLGIYRSNEELTYYYIAVLLIGAFMAFFKVLYSVLSPYLAQISASPPEILRQKFVLLFRWFFQICIVLCLVLYFLSQPFILSVYGRDYIPTVWIFRLLLLIFILRAASNPIAMFLVNVFGDTKQVLRNSLVTVAANVILNLLLIPKYGYYGAVIASLTAYILGWGYILIFIKKIRKMIPGSVILKSAAALVIVALLNYLLFLMGFYNLYFLCLLSPGVYLLLLAAFKEIKAKDILLIRRVLKIVRITG